MSRTLARLRAATGDPLLVRAGRSLVPTPRAIELREQVNDLVRTAVTVLRPVEIDLASIARTFTIRTGEGFVENFGPALIDRVNADAPRIRLCFVHKLNRESAPLRDGSVDLETGVVGKATGPEVRTRALFRDRFIGAVRAGHPLTTAGVTTKRFCRYKHVEVPQHVHGPVDGALAKLDIEREVSTVVGGFSSALALARSTDLVACVPERHTELQRDGMHTFELPFATPEIKISMLWHPRLDADPAHIWLRQCVRDVCSDRRADAPTPRRISQRERR